MATTKTQHEVAPAATDNAGTVSHNLRYAWYVVFVLMACCMLSFVDRQILSLLVGPIKRDLAISDTQIGLLQGLAFALFYTIMGLPIGRMADRRNRRNLITIGLILWTGFASSCSAAKSFLSLFVRRIGVGIGEASLSPAAFSLISDYFPKERVGAAFSVYYMGIFLGSSLALIVGGIVVDVMMRFQKVTLPILGTVASWRVAFLIDIIPGLLLAILLFSTIREPLRRNLLRTARGDARKLGFGETCAQVRLRWQSVVGISLGMIFQSMCSYAFLSWAPTFFVRTHGWTPGQAGRALGVIVAVFGCAGMYVGGRLCDRWQRQGIYDAPLRVVIPSAVGAGILFPIAFTTHSVAWTLALMGPALFFLALPIATAVAALQLIFPNQVRGQVSALYLFFQNLGGLTLGPLMPGVFNDYLFKSERMIGPSVALTIGVASMLALVVFLATFRSYREHYRMMYAAGVALASEVAQ